jgi:PAS domain S-box-containing protein
VIQAPLMEQKTPSNPVPELIEAVLENSYDIISILAIDNTIIYESPAVTRVLGFLPHELIGTNKFELVHPDDVELLKRELEEVSVQGAGEVLPYRCRTKTGDWRWLESTVAMITHPPYEGRVMVHSRDVTRRKEAEAEVHRKNREISETWESMTDAFYTVDKEWRFTYINKQSERLLRRTRAELLGRNVWEEFPAAEGLLAPHYHRSVTERITLEFEIFYPPLETWFEIHIYPTPSGLSVYFYDINDRKAMEVKDREDREFLQSILDALTSHVAVLNEDGVIVTTNASWQNFLLENEGETLHCGVGANYLDACDKATGDAIPIANEVAAGIREIIAGTRNQFSLEYSCLTPVRERWFNVKVTRFNGHNPVSIVIAHEDITERKLAENLRSNFTAIIETTEDAIIGIDVNRAIASWNPGAERVYGYKAEEIIGQHYDILIPPEQRTQYHEHVEKILAQKRSILLEANRYRADGSLIHVSTRVTPVCNAAGGVIGACAITRDITEQKQAQEERDRFFTLSLDMLCIVDNNAHFKRVNPAFERILGYSEAELTARPFMDFIHPDDVAKTEDAVRQLASGIPVTYLLNRYRCHDGTYKSISWVSAPYGNIYYAAGRDITELEGAQEELERSLALFQATLESTHDGILAVDEAGQITHCNQRFIDMWNIPQELIDTQEDSRILDYVKDQMQDPQEFIEAITAVYRDPNTQSFDVLYLRDGRVFERYSKSQIINEVSRGRIWDFSDVTERSRAEKEQMRLNMELDEERRRLTDILESVPGIVWENHVDSDTLRQYPIYISDYLTTMLGYSPAELLYSAELWAAMIHPDDQRAATAKIRAMIERKHGDTFLQRMVAKDGSEIWTESYCSIILNWSGRVAGVRGVTMDVTDRMKALEEQSHLAALLEATSDLVGWTTPAGITQYLNPAGRVMLGLGLQDPVEGRPFTDFISADAHTRFIEESLPQATIKGAWSGETTFCNSSGREIPISQVITAHKNVQGDVKFFSTVSRDISDRKAAEFALVRAKDELEERVQLRTQELAQSNDALLSQMEERQKALVALQEAIKALQSANTEAEMARSEAERANTAKSEFLSRMSHELRTPLNAILGFGQILELSKLDVLQEESVGHILKAGDHLLDLINEVLDISRMEAGTMSLSIEPVPLWEVVKEAIDLVRPLGYHKEIQIYDDETEHCLHHILADRQRLKQVLINLLSNAIKYNIHGGRVGISCQLLEGNILRFGVEDTGYGMSAEDMKKIFTPFERLGNKVADIEGTGLGLALSRRLTEAMGGTLHVESLPGQGSIFYIELPCVDSKSKTRDSEQQTNSNSPTNYDSEKTYTVLLIEDNISNQRFIQAILAKRPRIQLLATTQGRIGLELVQKHKPDLLLLDLHLPDISGEEVLRSLQQDEATQNIPVVICSADATPSQIQRLRSAGAKQYLTKPLNVKRLLEVVDKILNM